MALHILRGRSQVLPLVPRDRHRYYSTASLLVQIWWLANIPDRSPPSPVSSSLQGCEYFPSSWSKRGSLSRAQKNIPCMALHILYIIPRINCWAATDRQNEQERNITIRLFFCLFLFCFLVLSRNTPIRFEKTAFSIPVCVT